MRTPNLFIVGAPRCGTTSMWHYLRQHPDIFMAAKKELHHFGSDIIAHQASLIVGEVPDEDEQPATPGYFQTMQIQACTDRAEYLSHFAEADQQRWVGEASPFYMYSQDAARGIAAFCPEARVLALLRNPIDMMHSMHAIRFRPRDRYGGQEAAALAAESHHGRRANWPPDALGNSPDRFYLYYRDLARYAEQLQRFYNVFDAHQIHVIMFDDLARDTAGVFQRTCAFLDIDERWRPEFAIQNATSADGSATLPGASALSPARWIYRTALPESLRRRIRETLLRRRAIKGRPVPRALRRALQREFADEVAALGELIGRDLSGWTRGQAEHGA